MHSNKPTATNQQLTEFHKMLHQHDWTYMMSDSDRVYQQGKAAERAIRDEAKRLGDKAEQMYADCYEFVWRGGKIVKLEDYLGQD